MINYVLGSQCVFCYANLSITQHYEAITIGQIRTVIMPIFSATMKKPLNHIAGSDMTPPPPLPSTFPLLYV